MQVDQFIFENQVFKKIYNKREGRYRFYKDDQEISLAAWNSWVNKYQPMSNKETHPSFLVRLLEKQRRRLVLKLTRPLADDLIADIGCEEGYISASIAPNCKKILCVDVDVNVLLKAREKVSSFKAIFVCCNAENLPLKRGVFDKMVCLETLEHLSNPAEAIKELVRVAKPTGQIVIGVPNEKFILLAKKFLFKLKISRILGKLSSGLAMGHLHSFDGRLFESLLNGQNLTYEISYSRPFFLNIYAVIKLDAKK